MAAGSLDSAGRVKFRKQSNQHALSLTNPGVLTQGPLPFFFWRSALFFFLEILSLDSNHLGIWLFRAAFHPHPSCLPILVMITRQCQNLPEIV